MRQFAMYLAAAVATTAIAVATGDALNAPTTTAAANVASETPADCTFAPDAGTRTSAAAEIQSLGWSEDGKFHHSFAGLELAPADRITVFRVPDAELDRTVRQIAADRGLCVELTDAPLSRWDMTRLADEVNRRSDKLDDANAPIESISRQARGHVVVGVAGDVEAAERILAGLEHVSVAFSDGRAL